MVGGMNNKGEDMELTPDQLHDLMDNIRDGLLTPGEAAIVGLAVQHAVRYSFDGFVGRSNMDTVIAACERRTKKKD